MIKATLNFLRGTCLFACACGTVPEKNVEAKDSTEKHNYTIATSTPHQATHGEQRAINYSFAARLHNSQALHDIDEEPGIAIDSIPVSLQLQESPFRQQPVNPSFIGRTLSRTALADPSDTSIHQYQAKVLERSVTEPSIPLPAKVKSRSSPGGPPGTSRLRPKMDNNTSPRPLSPMRLSVDNTSPSPQSLMRLSVTPSMELRLAAATKIREIAAMYAERDRVSRERGAQSLKEAEAEREKKRATAKLTSVRTAQSLQLLQDRSNALRKPGITAPLQRVGSGRASETSEGLIAPKALENRHSASLRFSFIQIGSGSGSSRLRPEKREASMNGS